MKLYKRICALALCILAIAAFVPSQAQAADYIDTDRNCRLNINYLGKDSEAMKNVQFDIYRVASVSETLEYKLTGSFTSYPVNLKGLDNSGWQALASTLQGYVARDKISAYDTGTTNLEGKLSFPNRRSTLLPGLYLVIAKQHVQSGVNYSVSPCMVSLPAYDGHNDSWVYETEMRPKYESVTYSQRRVVKVWNDEKSSSRPRSVQVSLMQDDKVYETVTLDKDNSWRYTWRDLDPKYTWTMVEQDVPTGYTVEVTRDNYTFYVTNTLTGTGTAASGGGRGGGGGGGGGGGAKADETELLPQTGQLWWPVPLLFGLGLSFYAYGHFGGRGKKYGE